MVAITKWVERKFVFDYPVGVFPCVLERVRGTPARLEEIVNGLPAEALTTRPGDAWSIQEQVGHLLEVDRLHRGRLDDYDDGVEVLRAADMTNRATVQADYNSRNMRTILASFRSDRMDLVKRLESMDEAQVARSAQHPRINQPMRVIDMAVFTAEHDDHHVACIAELARKLRR